MSRGIVIARRRRRPGMDDGVVVVRFRLGIDVSGLIQRLHGPEAVLGELGRAGMVRLGPGPDDGIVCAGGRLQVRVAALLVEGGELPQQPLGAVGPGRVGAVGVGLDDGRVGVGVGGDAVDLRLDHPPEDVLGISSGIAPIGFGKHGNDLGVHPNVEEVGDLPLHLLEQIRQTIGGIGLGGVHIAPRLQKPAVGAILLPFRVEPFGIRQNLVGRSSELGQFAIRRRRQRFVLVVVDVDVNIVQRAQRLHGNVRSAGQIAPGGGRRTGTGVDPLVVKGRPSTGLAARRDFSRGTRGHRRYV